MMLIFFSRANHHRPQLNDHNSLPLAVKSSHVSHLGYWQSATVPNQPGKCRRRDLMKTSSSSPWILSATFDTSEDDSLRTSDLSIPRTKLAMKPQWAFTPSKVFF